jgi:hypothetical protein
MGWSQFVAMISIDTIRNIIAGDFTQFNSKGQKFVYMLFCIIIAILSFDPLRWGVCILICTFIWYATIEKIPEPGASSAVLGRQDNPEEEVKWTQHIVQHDPDSVDQTTGYYYVRWTENGAQCSSRKMRYSEFKGLQKVLTSMGTVVPNPFPKPESATARVTTWVMTAGGKSKGTGQEKLQARAMALTTWLCGLTGERCSKEALVYRFLAAGRVANSVQMRTNH